MLGLDKLQQYYFGQAFALCMIIQLHFECQVRRVRFLLRSSLQKIHKYNVTFITNVESIVASLILKLSAKRSLAIYIIFMNSGI